MKNLLSIGLSILMLTILLSQPAQAGGCGAGGSGGTGGGCGCSGGCGGGCGGAGGCGAHAQPLPTSAQGNWNQAAAQAAESARKAQFVKDNQTMSKATKVNNTACPTCGDEIDPKAAYQVYHKGQLVNLCCEHCLEEFSKDPDAYLAKALKSKRTVSDEITK